MKPNYSLYPGKATQVLGVQAVSPARMSCFEASAQKRHRMFPSRTVADSDPSLFKLVKDFLSDPGTNNFHTLKLG